MHTYGVMVLFLAVSKRYEILLNSFHYILLCAVHIVSSNFSHHYYYLPIYRAISA